VPDRERQVPQLVWIADDIARGNSVTLDGDAQGAIEFTIEIEQRATAPLIIASAMRMPSMR
jgi:hypothetical protein